MQLALYPPPSYYKVVRTHPEKRCISPCLVSSPLRGGAADTYQGTTVVVCRPDSIGTIAVRRIINDSV